jgi:gamma-glutamylcyclotransferase
MLYFAYAENMDLETLSGRGVKFAKVCNGKLKNLRLAFRKPGDDGTGKADLMEGKGSMTEGVVFDVPEESLDNLDVYEGVDKGHYRRHTIIVDTWKGQLECVTYRAAKFRNGLKPSTAYLETIIRAAEAHRLSQDYINFLKSYDTAEGST